MTVLTSPISTGCQTVRSGIVNGMTTFPSVFIALFVAHQVADHWFQTQHQADVKGAAGWAGRIACATHVLVYTAVAVAFLLAGAAVLGVHLDVGPVAAGLAVSAATHYFADRRAPLRRLALLARKSTAWLDHGGGMYCLDQSWHIGWLFVAALVIA